MPLRNLVGLVAILCFAGLTFAQPDTEIPGVLLNLDEKVGTITARVRIKLRSHTKTYNLIKPDLPVTGAGGQILKLRDLKIKQRIFLTVVLDMDVVAIRLQDARIKGQK